MILVTGAAGFVGRSLMAQLADAAIPAAGYHGLINDTIRLREALAGADAVVHLAGAESRGRNWRLKLVDVEGTRALLDECRRAEVGRLIVLSRLNADPNALYPLLRAKGQAERLIRAGEVPYTIVRSATLFGRDDRFLNVIAGLAAWTWPVILLPAAGQVATQPLWVEDLARCLIAALDRPDFVGKTVELAGEERLRYAEIARLVLNEAGLKRRPIGLSPKLVRPLARVLFGWQRRPAVTRYFMDRFSVPEVAPLDSVPAHFGFRPARLPSQIAYLRRPGTRWRLLRR